MIDPRRLALDALVRIDAGGAYANLLVPALLDDSDLPVREKAFATELVYGTTRMRRACDWLVDRFTLSELDPTTRAALRLGAYQLAFLGTPPHAAVNATVSVAPRRVRGLVNAVLRRVATAPRDWPDVATRLSYPDWIIERLVADLGEPAAIAALEQMNEAGTVTRRADGYVQDLASQWVAELVGASQGERVADLCAAPGGKATLMAGLGARVVASDRRPSRARLVAGNVSRLGCEGMSVVAADGTRPPYRPGSFDRVLVDAPCSNLGALRRRPDARWRIAPQDVAPLAELQADLLDAAIGLARPGGVVAFSVCTLTDAEGLDHDRRLAVSHPELVALPPPGPPWEPLGRGARLLPQAAGTDGMVLLRYRIPGDG